MERRISQRVALERPCVIRRSGSALCDGVTRDIGRGGALVAVVIGAEPRNFFYGEEIEMEIQLEPNATFAPKCIHCRGMVVRVEGLGPGLAEIAIEFHRVGFRVAKYTAAATECRVVH